MKPVRGRIARAAAAVLALAVWGALGALTGPGASLAAAGTGSNHTDGSEVHLHLEGAWARPARAGENTAIYFTVTNTGEDDVTITGSSSDAATMAQIHETVMEMAVVDGKPVQTVRMQHIPGLTVPAGETVVLRPGGLHVMLLSLTRDLNEGDHVELRLELARGGALTLAVPVRLAAPGMEAAGPEGHGH
ncbi:MAG: copper chaperone PCu(A)C [Firmicutes bacterium]|nr:copper chaperone PCu(A)C [Bacillota bacterium]